MMEARSLKADHHLCTGRNQRIFESWEAKGQAHEWPLAVFDQAYRNDVSKILENVILNE